MQQEDRFFYGDQNKDDPTNTNNSNSARSSYTYNNPYSTSSPPHDSWSSRSSVDPNIAIAQNPFGDEVSRQNTLTEEPVDCLADTTKVLNELQADEEKQAEKEERDLELNSTGFNTATTTPAQSTVGDEPDSDREFDWDDDPDQVKPKRRKTARERFTAAMKRPCCWNYLSPLIKRIIIAIVGSCIFIIIAVVIYYTLPEPTEAEKSDPNFKNIRSNVQCWMYWAAFMWHIYWISTFMLDMVPSVVSLFSKFFHGRRSEKVKSYMEVSQWEYDP